MLLIINAVIVKCILLFPFHMKTDRNILNTQTENVKIYTQSMRCDK